jgi:hypothetical protein
MSELINNSSYRKGRLKELILKLHDGESPDLGFTQKLNRIF